MKSRTRRIALLCTLFALLVVCGARAGGFGSMIFKRMKTNVKDSAKRRLERTKDRVKSRVTSGRDRIIGAATGNQLGAVATGQINRDTLKESLRMKVKDKLSEINPIAGSLADGENPRDGLRASIRERIDAMKQNLSGDALKERLKQNAMGDVPIPGEGEEFDSGNFADAVKAKLQAIKERRERRALGRVTDAVDVMDDVGVTSDELDLNSSSMADFAAIDGISEGDALKIVEYREEHGEMEEEDLIKAVGFKKYLLLRTFLGGGDDDDDYDDYDDDDDDE